MKVFTLFLIAAVSAALAIADPITRGEAEAGHDPFDALVEQYEAFVRDADPEHAARAERAAPDRWPNVTPSAVESRAEVAASLLARLEAIQTDRTDDAAILARLLQPHLDAQRFDTARIPFTGDSGFHSAPVFAALRTRIATESDADAWIARLEDLPRYFSEHVENMRRGMQSGWTAHSDPLATTMDQIREQIVENPEKSGLYAPFRDLPDAIPPEDMLRLRREGREAVAGAVGAYEDLLRFLELDYAGAARPEPGLVSLDHGRAAYAAAIEHHTAGAGFVAEEIHQIGEAEVARIRAEMETAIAETGFDGDFDAFVAFLRSDRAFYARSPDALIEKASEISKRLDAMLPLYFRTLPRLPYGVSPVPAAIAPGYTTGRYVQGDPESGRAGAYLVNTYDLSQRPLYQLPALSAHEAVPGHHLQIALAQELADRPRFRRDYYATAFGEGWGLYAERLAGEAGIYQTPYERFGALSYEMWRACRLVADTGLHWYGWSRAQAEACFKENTALAPLNIQTEVTRYIGWPGQATAYKIGELKILELRDRAEAALGDDFDIRDFHDALLGAGSLPLDRLEARIDSWIADRLDALNAASVDGSGG